MTEMTMTTVATEAKAMTEATTTTASALISVQDAASIAGLAPNTIYRWIRDGRIPAAMVVKLGGTTVRLKRVEFATWAGLA